MASANKFVDSRVSTLYVILFLVGCAGPRLELDGDNAEGVTPAAMTAEVEESSSVLPGAHDLNVEAKSSEQAAAASEPIQAPAGRDPDHESTLAPSSDGLAELHRHMAVSLESARGESSSMMVFAIALPLSEEAFPSAPRPDVLRPASNVRIEGLLPPDECDFTAAA
jgi:hypothetical protein